MNETLSPFRPYNPPTPPQPPVTEGPLPVVFSGDRAGFFGLLVRGALLGLVTVGFYRFWLATDIRRHLWSNTSVNGDAPEYTGTAMELLIGFLFALAILVPIYLAYFFIGLEAERLQAFASIPFGLFFYFFAQFAIYRARRYRLTRTVWRGVRFWMRGSGWLYAGRAGLWALAVIFTLGALLPWRTASLERYKMSHSNYGGLQGHFVGEGREFFRRAWKYWAILWGALIATIAFAFIFPPLAIFLAFAIIIAVPFLYARYRAVEWSWWVSGVRFGEVSFESSLPSNALTDLYWKVIGWIFLLSFALSAGVGSVFGSLGATGRVDFQKPEDILVLLQNPLTLILVGICYLITVLAIGAFVRLYLTRDLWQRIASSTAVYNLAAANNVAAEGELAGALGEGFADSLDVAGF